MKQVTVCCWPHHDDLLTTAAKLQKDEWKRAPVKDFLAINFLSEKERAEFMKTTSQVLSSDSCLVETQLGCVEC